MMFMFAFVCFNNACVINVLAAIVKHNKLNVNDLQKCYSLLLLHEIVYDIHKEQSAARLRYYMNESLFTWVAIRTGETQRYGDPSQTVSNMIYSCIIIILFLFDLQERQKGKVSSEQAEREMADTKHELLRIRQMMELAEKVDLS